MNQLVEVSIQHPIEKMVLMITCGSQTVTKIENKKTFERNTGKY